MHVDGAPSLCISDEPESIQAALKGQRQAPGALTTVESSQLSGTLPIEERERKNGRNRVQDKAIPRISYQGHREDA